MANTNRYALIVAGGSGSRMNAPVSKQFLLLNGLPILMHTLNRFYRYDSEIELILVLPQDQFEYWETLCSTYKFDLRHLLVAGGDVRFQSVKNGIDAIKTDGLVAIHDGVRPLVSTDTIDRCFKTAGEKGNALPVLPMIESVRMIEKNKNYHADREKYVVVQTPQVFRVSDIKRAYNMEFDPSFTDDATVLERLGIQINLVEGNRENIKITHPTDLIVANAFTQYLE